MYKVFFKERIVFLTNNIERDLSESFGAIFKYSNPKELNDFISNFITKEDVEQAFIYHHDVDALFEIFCKYFKLIDAAGGIVYNKNNDILFIHRLGKWDLPKGKAEKGESIEETATREVEEECGISNVKILNKAQNTYHTYPHKGDIVLKTTHWYNMTYEGNENLTPQAEEDIEKALWLKPTNLDAIFENTYPSIKELIENHIKK